jgi:hypothetical protein
MKTPRRANDLIMIVARVVEVEAAVERLRPTGCLIRSVD